MPAAPNPGYDLLSLVPAGIVVQRSILDGLAAAYAANSYQPLSPTQILAVTGPSPLYPTSLRRNADSNPQPREG